MNAEDIKRMRAVLGLTQPVLAKMIGVSLKTVANYESGGKIPISKYAILEKLIDDSKYGSIRNNIRGSFTGSTFVGGDNMGIISRDINAPVTTNKGGVNNRIIGGFNGGTFNSQIGDNINSYIGGDSPKSEKKKIKESDLEKEIIRLSQENTVLSQKIDILKSEVNKPSVSYSSGRPYYNVDFIGGFDLVLNDQTINPEYNIDFQPYNKDGVIWCNLTGHSMEPEISNGDVIAIKEVKEWDKFLAMNETYAIITKNDFRTVKKLRRGSDNSHLLLVPVNKEYDEQEIAKDMIIKVYSILGCMKRF